LKAKAITAWSKAFADAGSTGPTIVSERVPGVFGGSSGKLKFIREIDDAQRNVFRSAGGRSSTSLQSRSRG